MRQAFGPHPAADGLQVRTLPVAVIVALGDGLNANGGERKDEAGDRERDQAVDIEPPAEHRRGWKTDPGRGGEQGHVLRVEQPRRRARRQTDREADEEVVAHEWLVRVFEPVVRAIPKDLRGKLETPEMFHQLLEHRWYLSQNEGRAIPLAEALSSYIDTVLRHRR
ncbi:MAG: hypothetical protein B7Z45_09830, partial [Azorhizobium sp. 12-66-6]